MPDSQSLPPPASSTPNWPRRLAVLTLVGLLLAVGVYDERVLAFFSNAWQVLLTALHLDAASARLHSGQSGGLHRPTLPGLSYVGLYLGICLLLLRLLLRQPGHWLLALRLYSAVLLAYLLLQLLSKAGHQLWAYSLSRHLVGFLVSPVPVLVLVVLLRGARPVVT